MLIMDNSFQLPIDILSEKPMRRVTKGLYAEAALADIPKDEDESVLHFKDTSKYLNL